MSVGFLVAILNLEVALVRAAPSAPPGYSVTPKMDCGYPVCQTIVQQVLHKNATALAKICDKTPGCEGFNSNGWLKKCLPPRCMEAASGMEPGAPCDLYVKLGPPDPTPPPAPPAPVPSIEDPFYPIEERDEENTASVPQILSADAKADSCRLRSAAGVDVNASAGDQVFDNWVVMAIINDDVVVLERRFDKWGLLVFASAKKEILRMRKPLGHLSMMRSTAYDFTTREPDYYTKAASDPHDYIGTRIVDDSEFGEADYLTAAKFLPPLADFIVIGDVKAPVIAVVAMDGKVKRTDGGDDEPPAWVAASTSASASILVSKSASSVRRGGRSRHRSRHRSRQHESADIKANGKTYGTQTSASSSNACQGSADCPDRTYCVNGTCASGGTTVFNAAAYLNLSTSLFEHMQSGVLGGYMRVASVGCFNTTGIGFELLGLGPLKHDNDTVLVAVRKYDPSLDTRLNASFRYLSLSLNQQRCTTLQQQWHDAACQCSAATFYTAVAEHGLEWEAAFGAASGGGGGGIDTSMKVSIPYNERRQVDMAKGVIVSSATVWTGDEPNYGTGGHYWKSGPPRRAMQDTSGIAGSLPLTSLALDEALLRWGLFGSVRAKVGFYLDTFIFANGTIDMGHWKDKWADGGDGRYNCTFPDGLSDHGRIVQLFTDTVRYTRDTGFLKAHLAAARRIGEYLLRSRRAAVAAFPATDPRHGIVHGPAEHDTCAMGMGGLDGTPPVPVVDGQHMLYYFSVSMWHWRGMVELGSLLLDFPQGADTSSFARSLLAEAIAFKADIERALNTSVVRDSKGAVVFVPCAVVPAGETCPIYRSMTDNIVASYSNFRYYSEMLGSGFMAPEMAVALMNFRETHGGTLSGMTRYADHLDDMPAIGYAVSSLAYDRVQQYLLLLHGHAANYQGRGSFFTTEQQSLYQLQGSRHWRASLGEIQADFCTPSQTLVSTMTAMQLVDSDRDSPMIWLARAAPRRWYAPSIDGTEGGFGVVNAPTRYGNVSFSLTPREGDVSFDVGITANFVQPAGSNATRARIPTMRIRVRDPQGKERPLKIVFPPSRGSECEIKIVDSSVATESVDVQSGTDLHRCDFAVGF